MVTRCEYAGVAVSLLLGLTACTPVSTATPSATVSPTPSVTSASPTPSSTPTWSADQQAAVDKVEAYYKVFNEVMRQERHPNDLATVARNDALGDAQRSYNQLGMAELTVQGDVVVGSLVPGTVKDSDDRPTVVVRLCEDTTSRQVVDKSGKQVGVGAVRSVKATLQAWDNQWFVTAFADGRGQC